MILTLTRLYLSDKSTIGELSLNGEYLCMTLEDVVREPGIKIYGETAIPYGSYHVILNHSTRFNKIMPLIYNQPNLTISDGINTWEGIRIHSGNTAVDTLGCVLVGLTHSTDSVGDSRKAFKLLMSRLEGQKQPFEMNVVKGAAL